MNNMKSILALLITTVLFIACNNKNTEPSADPDVYYTCSMDPQVKENKPGKCPICKMELSAVKKSNRQNSDEIELSEQQVQLGNIHTDTIGKSKVGNQVILNATLNFDQQKTDAVSSRIAGRIDKLYYKNIGEFVPQGAKLFDIYSEELNNAKQEYLLTLEKQKTLGNAVINFDQLAEAAKNKLLLWGMSLHQITELEKTGISAPLTSYYSQVSGYVTSIEISEGDNVMEGATMLRLADLSTLWAEVQVYSSQLSDIDRDGQAIVQFPDIPGIKEKGKIEFINPETSPDTRINLIRVSIPNQKHELKPGMSAYVTIKNREFNTLSLPADAVIRSGNGALVWIQTGKNKFKYKMVDLGTEVDDLIEIKSGLNAGDVVVISGAYLLNSEYIFKTGTNPMAGMKM
jgi:membrane fusion protein, copper/silver efflux system